MISKTNPRLAFVTDTLPFVAGAEKVLEAALQVFPETPIYTLIYNRMAFKNTIFERQTIHTSVIDRVPFAHTRHRYFLPIYPLAIEQFDLREFEVIVSFSYAVAHGLLPRADQLHISFVYTPLRHVWDYYHQFLQDRGLTSGLRGWLAKILLHYMRLWDLAAADRVDRFVAISRWGAECIWRAYRRPAEVIYPPVDVDQFLPLEPRDNYYVTLSRLVPHKKVSIIVEAFSKLGLPLIVVGEGEEHNRLVKKIEPNVKLLGRVSDEAVRQLLGRAKALIHAAEEDFGIGLVEGQAAGCPVITYGRGAARETVIPGKTGLFFSEQTPESLAQVVHAFEAGEYQFAVDNLRSNALRFSKERFKEEFRSLVLGDWDRFRNHWTEEGGVSWKDRVQVPKFVPKVPFGRGFRKSILDGVVTSEHD